MKSPISDVLRSKGERMLTTSPDCTVAEAVSLMNEAGFGSVTVLDGGRLAGIFTERDVLARVIDAQRDPATTLVDEVMTPDPLCIGPDALVEDVIVLITENHCRHLPVVEDGSLVGLISIGDLMRWVVRDQDRRIDAMLRAMRVVSHD